MLTQQDSGFTYDIGGYRCTQVINTSLEIYRPGNTMVTTLHQTLLDHFYDSNFNVSTVTAGTKIAAAVLIYWNASDLSLFESSYASALAKRLDLDFTPTAAPNISLPTASPASTPNIPGPTSTPTPTLTRGATIGISIGATFGAAIVAIIAFFIFKYLHRNRRDDKTKQEEGVIEVGMPELARDEEVKEETHEIAHEGNASTELASPVAELEG
jgi:hypothetical protein